MRIPAHARTRAFFLFALISVLLVGCTLRDSPQDPPLAVTSNNSGDSYGSGYSMKPTVANNPAYKKNPMVRKNARSLFPSYVIMLPEHLTGYEERYKGAIFPLYCGYITINEDDMPIFVKKTKYPVDSIDYLLIKIEKDNGNISTDLICNYYSLHSLCKQFLENAINNFIMFDYERYYDVIQLEIWSDGIKLVFPTVDFSNDLYFEHPESIIDDNYVPRFTKTCTLTGDREADRECLKMKFPGHITDYIKKENPPKIWRPAKEKEKVQL